MSNEIANKTFTNYEDGSSHDEHPHAHFWTFYGKLENNNKSGVLRLGFAAELYKTLKGW